jgi:predicted AlkP superfamily phosphohydrolase/phosphomutase
MAEIKLKGAGFMEKSEEHDAFRADTKNSKAVPQRMIYVYVNLKGRDPDGVVDPEDYEPLQYQIIDALLSYVHPETGKRPVALALAKKDARILGLYGDGIGDVVYALYPEYSAQHGQQLPTAEWGIGSLKGLLVFNGPGIKSGVRLERTCSLVDLVPTVCYLLDWPVPEQAEGGILYQAFADANFKVKEVQRLREALAKLETELARQ